MAKRRVAVLVGSLRKEAFSRRLANSLISMQPDSLDMRIVEIGNLPLYNQDLETDSPPPAWTEYRKQLADSEAVLFVTPEYNRGMPAALKNAIDVGTRPYGKGAINGKPCAVASNSPGALGGFGANHQVRHATVFPDMPMMQMPELYVGHVDKVVDASGKPTSDGTRELFGKFLDAFSAWIEKNGKRAA